MNFLQSLPPWAIVIVLVLIVILSRQLYFRTRKFDDCFEKLDDHAILQESEDGVESRVIIPCFLKARTFCRNLENATLLGWHLGSTKELELFREKFRGVTLWGSDGNSDIDDIYPVMVDGKLNHYERPYVMKPGDIFLLVKTTKKNTVMAKVNTMSVQKI